MLRLLLLTAHPDDEAGGFGGTLLLYARRGVQTNVICLTPGQAARNRGSAKSDDELSAIRREEFARSCKLLGVFHGEVLDFPDSKLDRTDFYSMVEEVTLRVRQIRPQVMVTFGPEGSITAHPDHGMASLVATTAFHWAGRKNRLAEQLGHGLKPWIAQKLYYATSAERLEDREPVSLSPWNVAIDIGEHFETKLAAFKMHTTQNPLYERFANNMRRLGRRELFHLAAASEPREMIKETDLFARVKEDGE
jgi:LmbE family N-acetylglucosaminyl deacetylase